MDVAHDLLMAYRAKSWLLSALSESARPASIQDFLERYLEGVGEVPRLPTQTLILDRHGVARELSLAAGQRRFNSEILSSYRVSRACCTILTATGARPRVFPCRRGRTAGSPATRRRSRKQTVRAAAGPRAESAAGTAAPAFHRRTTEPARMFVSLLLRPLVCPEVPGPAAEKTMEIRFFAPASLVSNLDFVESIFGNAGDPHLPENDAALDVMHWTGHTGCVILAPHLAGTEESRAGPAAQARCHRAPAPRRHVLGKRRRTLQRRQCLQDLRATNRGVMVTVIADNYYGYCKKEVKTQISLRPICTACARKNTPAARWPSRRTPWARISKRADVSLKATFAAGMDLLRRYGRAAAGGLRDRPALSGDLLRSGRLGVQRPRRT